MTDKAKRPYDEYDDSLLFYEDMDVVSQNECTGLIPTPAKTDREVSSYSEIYDIPLSRDDPFRK